MSPEVWNSAWAGCMQMKRDIFIISRATDYKITLVFRLKAQSRAMGNTADT